MASQQEPAEQQQKAAGDVSWNDAQEPMHQNASFCITPGETVVPGGPEDSIEELEATLSASQLRAMSLLLIGHSALSVSNAVGVNRTTVFRWRQQRAFATVLRFRQEALFHQATDRLRATLVKAVREVQQDLRSKYAHQRLQTAFRLLPYVGSPKLRPEEPKGPPVGTRARDELAKHPTR